MCAPIHEHMCRYIQAFIHITITYILVWWRIDNLYSKYAHSLCNILYAIEMCLLFSCLVLKQLILTMKPVWWPVLYHWPVLHGLCMHSFSFDLPLNQDTYKFLYMSICADTFDHSYIRIRMFLYVHAYLCTLVLMLCMMLVYCMMIMYIRTYIGTCVFTMHVHAYVHDEYVRTYIRTYNCVHNTYVHTYVRTYMCVHNVYIGVHIKVVPHFLVGTWEMYWGEIRSVRTFPCTNQKRGTTIMHPIH